MKKRILSIVLAICMVLSLMPTMAYAENGIHTVTVNAGEGGKLSTDGTSWSNSVSLSVNDGETLNGKVQYKADKGYVFDSVVPKIASVVAGGEHTVLLGANGNVWTTGRNSYGQLGLTGSSTSTFKQITVGDGVKIKTIAAGYYHTVLLDEDGNVWTAGYNKFGQLGRDANNGTGNANPTFTQVTIGNGVKIKAMAAGDSHTVLLDANGNVWTAGLNNYGQLGRDENKSTNNANPTFTKVTVGDGVKIKAIAAGDSHTVLLDEVGNVWTAGKNNYGQLGFSGGTTTTFRQVTDGIGGVRITAIAAGTSYTVLLDEVGNVWTAGWNNYGQLGRDENSGTDTANPTFKQVSVGTGVTIKAIAAGHYHTVLLDEGGNVWTAGRNNRGQLGRNENSGTNNKNTTFTQVTDGIGGVSITAITAGTQHTVLLDEVGNVWTTGSNTYGQLGISGGDTSTFAQATVNLYATTFDEFVNIPIHNNSVFLVKFNVKHTVTVNAGEGGKVSTDGTSWSNSVSLSVNDGETLNGKVQYKADKGYVFDGVVSKIASVASGTSHTVLLDANGNVWTTGYNVYGQLGLTGGTTSTFTQVTGGIGGVKITAIAAGTQHTVLLDKDGNVWTAGHNKYGQLGRDENSGTNNKNPTFTQVTVGDGVKIKAIAAGSGHTVLLDANGNVWTAGCNEFGQLGRDENSGTFNANPTFTQVTVGDGIKIKAIATSYDHTVLLDKDGNVWTAGYNGYGQLGFSGGNTSTFTQVTGGIGGVKITAIAGGGKHTVLLDEDGNVWTVGHNDFGQLGFSGGTNSTFVQITDGIGGVNITDIVAGYNYTILLDKDGNVWTAGYNYYGQLGRDENSGTHNKNTTFKQVTGGIGGLSITGIAAKYSHTVLLDEYGNVWTAGWNIYGQLGSNENFGTSNANPTFKQATVNLNAITFDEFVNIPIHNNSVFLTKFKDIQGPVITGLESNKTYCYAVQFEVSDNCGVASVKSGDTVLTTGENGKYTLATAGIGTLTIVATDTNGNTTEVTVTVKDEHSGGTATCTAKAVCEYCGEEYGKIAHNNHTSSKKWVYNNYQHSQYWECCRVVVVNYTDHIWNNGVCSVCDYACTHRDYDKNHLCDICGKTISDHTWSDGVCSVCGYVCTHKDENPKDYLCDYCGEEFSQVSTEAELKESIAANVPLIRLVSDIKLSSLLNLTDKIVTIDLNGYVLTGDIKLADSSASPQSILTLIDSRPTATHTDSSLPLGGVVKGNITLTRGNGSVSHLYANGGTVTGQTSMPSYAGGIYCTSDTPTAFKGFVGNYGAIHGGIFYGGINTDCIKEKTVTFMNGSSRYAIQVLAADNKVVEPISPPPSNAGYQTFIGWYNGDTKYTFGSTISESITLTAKHINPITYNISYNLAGGTATNQTTYNVESEAITLNNPTRLGYTFTGWSGTGLTGEDNMSVTIATGSKGNRTYTAHWQDIEPPVISGISNGATYCSAQTVSVSDNEGIDINSAVTVNGEVVTLDSNNQFILNPAEGTQTIVVTDKAGNISAEMIVTVNNGHTYEWQNDNEQYWQKCSICGYETVKKDIPTITINGADRVCLTQNYEFSFTLPDGATDASYGYDFVLKGEKFFTTIENNEAYGVVYASWYISSADSFEVYASAKTADGFEFSVRKTVEIQKEHIGGEATCVSKAICEICGEEYGDIDPENHVSTEIRNAIPATCTETGYSGDIHCNDCGVLLEAGKLTDITPHNYYVNVVEPTENKQGYTKYVCADCRYSYVGDITDYASDNSVLIAALETIESYSHEDYSTESFENLQAIYKQYYTMAKGSYAQIEIDNAAFDLITAISALEPYLNLNISAPYGKFTVNYNNETNSNTKHSLLFGTDITLTATANNGYEFVGWYDTVNNRYFSKNAEYSFKLTTNTKLKAVFVKEQSATLTFANYSNWVQSTVTKTIDEWNNVTSIDDLLPDVPYKYGYSNGRWVYNNAEVLAKLQTGENVSLIPEYDEDDTSLPTPPSPKGYTPALDLYYKLDADANVGSFVMAAGIPENCQLESVGIAFYYKNADEFDPSKFELTINNKMLVSRFNTDEIDDIYIVNLNKLTSKYNWAARGYVTYYDANGNLKTVYSNQINIVNREQV